MAYKQKIRSLAGNLGVANDHLVQTKDITEYNAFRGVTDFSQISQFTPYEGGYQMLALLKMPKFMTELAKANGTGSIVERIYNTFKHIVEYEFKGLDGLPDLNSDTYTITDGINDIRMIGKVTEDTSITVSSTYTERIGTPLTKFARLYLTGIKDPKTQARTYHGLIGNGQLDPDLANEVFTMMYIVTDNTMVRLEKAVLLCNMQLTKAEESIYNGNRGDIGNTKDITLEWNAYPVQSSDVDAIAEKILYRLTGIRKAKENETSVNGLTRTSKRSYFEEVTGEKNKRRRRIVELDSADYDWGVLNSTFKVGVGTKADKLDNPAYIPEIRNYGKKGISVVNDPDEDTGAETTTKANDDAGTPEE